MFNKLIIKWLEYNEDVNDLDSYNEITFKYNKIFEVDEIVSLLNITNIEKAFKRFNDKVNKYFEKEIEDHLCSKEKIFRLKDLLKYPPDMSIPPNQLLFHCQHLIELLQSIEEVNIEALFSKFAPEASSKFVYSKFSNYFKKYKKKNPVLSDLLILCDAIADYPNHIKKHFNKLKKMKPCNSSIEMCCSEIQSNFENKYLHALISSVRIEEAKKIINEKAEDDNLDEDLMKYIKSIEEIKSTISDDILYEKVLELKNSFSNLWKGKKSIPHEVHEHLQEKIKRLLELLKDEIIDDVRKGDSIRVNNLRNKIAQLINPEPFWENYNVEIKKLQSYLDHIQHLALFYEQLSSNEFNKAREIILKHYGNLASTDDTEVIRALMHLLIRANEIYNEFITRKDLWQLILKYPLIADEVGLLEIWCEDALKNGDYENIIKLTPKIGNKKNLSNNLFIRLNFIEELSKSRFRNAQDIIVKFPKLKKDIKKDVLDYMSFLEKTGRMIQILEIFVNYQNILNMNDHEKLAVKEYLSVILEKIKAWNDNIENGLLTINEIQEIKPKLEEFNSLRTSIEEYKKYFNETDIFDFDEIKKFQDYAKKFKSLHSFTNNILNKLEEMLQKKEFSRLGDLYLEYESLSTKYLMFPFIIILRQHISKLKSDNNNLDVSINKWQKLYRGDFETVEAGKETFDQLCDYFNSYLKNNESDKYGLAGLLDFGNDTDEIKRNINKLKLDLPIFLELLSYISNYKDTIIKFPTHKDINSLDHLLIEKIEKYKLAFEMPNADKVAQFLKAFFDVKFRGNYKLQSCINDIVTVASQC